MASPQPEPGVDITKSYEWRFRDPGFVAIWDRWQKARDAWRRIRESTLPFREGGPDAFYDPDPARITDPGHVAAAKEFQAARTAYTQEIGRRSDD